MSLLNIGKFLNNALHGTANAVTETTSSATGLLATAVQNVTADAGLDVHIPGLADLSGDISASVGTGLGTLLNDTASSADALITGVTSTAADVVTGVTATADSILTGAFSSAADILTGATQYGGLNIGIDAHIPAVLDLDASVGVLTPASGVLDVGADLQLFGASAPGIG